MQKSDYKRKLQMNIDPDHSLLVRIAREGAQEASFALVSEKTTYLCPGYNKFIDQFLKLLDKVN